MQHTICLWSQVRHQVANANVDYAKEPLVLLLEFLLVEHLYGKDTAFVGSAVRRRLSVNQSQARERERGVIAQVKALIPIWIQCPLANGGSLCLLAIDCSNSKRVGKACPLLEPVDISRVAGWQRKGWSVRKTSRL